ncbi:unnamed protein product [Linum trigynum]|uniref:Uncharacterized protein n=1 Tax=Linum trigynum TaxID=586398 RepID=A0AAV2D6I6_9ROSI
MMEHRRRRLLTTGRCVDADAATGRWDVVASGGGRRVRWERDGGGLTQPASQAVAVARQGTTSRGGRCLGLWTLGEIAEWELGRRILFFPFRFRYQLGCMVA